MDLQGLLQGYGEPGLAVALVALLAAAAALAAWVIASSILGRLARPSVLLSSMLTRIRQPARVVVPLVALQVVWTAAPDDLPMLSSVSRVTGLLLIVALTWLAIRGVAGVAEAVVRLHPANVSDNLEARRVQTQTRLLARSVMVVLMLIGLGAALMTFPNVRQVGASLLASAGVAGLVVGIAARPVIGSLIAGLQIALTQPIRLDDVVIIEGEWGRIEEITATYVVVKIWDQRRLVVPLQWVIEHPFQNWTRRDAELIGSVLLWLDYRVELAPLRAELERVCAAAPEWDGRVALLQVVDTSERALQLRALVSSQDASKNWDLRCRVREALIEFLQRQQPDALPRLRAEMEEPSKRRMHKPAAEPPLRAGLGDSSAIRRPEHPDKHAPQQPVDDGAGADTITAIVDRSARR